MVDRWPAAALEFFGEKPHLWMIVSNFDGFRWYSPPAVGMTYASFGMKSFAVVFVRALHQLQQGKSKNFS